MRGAFDQLGQRHAERTAISAMTATLSGIGTGMLTATVRRKRRGNGRGSVYYRNHSGYEYWVAAVQSRANGQRTTRYAYTKTEAEAHAKLAEIQEMQLEIGVAELKARFNT